MPDIVKCLILAAVVVAAAPAREAIAQQATLTNRPPESAAAGKGRPAVGKNSAATGGGDGKGHTIYMFIQTESTMTEAEVRDKFEAAQKATPECSIQSYDIHPIDQKTYTFLKSFARSGAIPPTTDGQADKLIEPRQGQDGAWTVDLQADTKYLESLKVKVGPPGGPDKEIAMKVEPKDVLNADLRYHSPGVYILKPKVPAGHLLKSVTLMVSDEAEDGSATPVPMEVTVPDLGRCYLLTLKGVEGDETKLYDTLKDEDKIANPILGLEKADKGSLVVASFKEMLAEPIVFKEDAIQLTFPKPGGKVKPKRLWMRFPLTNEEKDAVIQELDGKFAGEGFKTVPAWIRQNLLGDRLTPEGSTGWFQLPWNAEHQAFERTLPIDTKSWQDRLVNNREFMGDNAIMVYEFEGEDGSQRIIKLNDGKYYRPHQVAGWLTGLSNAPTADK